MLYQTFLTASSLIYCALTQVESALYVRAVKESSLKNQFKNTFVDQIAHQLEGDKDDLDNNDFVFDETDDQLSRISVNIVTALRNIKFDSTPTKTLKKPRRNGNWDIRDESSPVRLGMGKPFTTNSMTVGATFRSPQAMGGYGGSCQYVKGTMMKWVDSGYNPYLVGVGSALFDSSRACGQCFLIYNPETKKAIISVVTDFCPGCSPRQLDIQSAGSAFLASGNTLNSKPYNGGPENFDNLHLWPVECDWKGRTLAYYFDKGSNKFHWYLIIYWMNVPVTDLKVEKMTDSSYSKVIFTAIVKGHDRFGRWVVSFQGRGGAGYYRLTMEGKAHSKTIVDKIYWNGASAVNVKGKTNFPLQKRPLNIQNWPQE